MNKQISRSNRGATINIILVAVVLFLIVALFYDAVQYNATHQKLDKDTIDSLKAMTPESAAPASDIPPVVSEEPKPADEITSIPVKEAAPQPTVAPSIEYKEEAEESILDVTEDRHLPSYFASGESFGLGDRITFLGKEGTLLDGKVKDGKITSPVLKIGDGQEIILIYYQKDHYIYGLIELIMYPQQEGRWNSAIMKQNGEELDVCLVYDSEIAYLTYVNAVFEPYRVSPYYKSLVLC